MHLELGRSRLRVEDRRSWQLQGSVGLASLNLQRRPYLGSFFRRHGKSHPRAELHLQSMVQYSCLHSAMSVCVSVIRLISRLSKLGFID